MTVPPDRRKKRAAFPPSPFLHSGPSCQASLQGWRKSVDNRERPSVSAPKDPYVPRLLWTKAEVARQLGVSEGHIDNLVRAKQLVATYVGSRKKMFTAAAVQAFIASGQTPREMGYERLEKGRERLEAPDHAAGPEANSHTPGRHVRGERSGNRHACS